MLKKMGLLGIVVVCFSLLAFCGRGEAQEPASLQVETVLDFRDYSDVSRVGYMIGIMDYITSYCPTIKVHANILEAANWGEVLKLFDRITGVIERQQPGWMATTKATFAIESFLFNVEEKQRACNEAAGTPS